MDNHLWEHEDIVGAKLIVCVLNACELGVWKSVVVLLLSLDTCRVFCGLVMDYSVFWFESVFRFVLFMYKLSTKSLIFFALVCCIYFLTQIILAQTHKCSSACAVHLLTSTPFKCSPSQTGQALAFQLTLFPLQMPTATWEMSGSLRQHCLASSNICEVLSSSLQLRRAVSQESRLLTRNTAETA